MPDYSCKYSTCHCNRPSPNDAPARPSTVSRHWFEPLYSYLDIDLMTPGDTVFDYIWTSSKYHEDSTKYRERSVLFGPFYPSWMFRLSTEELKFLTGIKNFDFNGHAFTYYKEFILEYGLADDYHLLDTVYDFTNEDLEWHLRNSPIFTGVDHIAPRIQWDPLLIFLTIDENVIGIKKDRNKDHKSLVVNTIGWMMKFFC